MRNPENHQELFEQLTKDLPRFEDGRVNYRGVAHTLILNVTVYFNGKILIVQRSNHVSTYPGLWSGISGFIDEPGPIEEHAIRELEEELGFERTVIEVMQIANSYLITDERLGRSWQVFPVLAQLNHEPPIILNWENCNYKWIDPQELPSYKIIQGFETNVAKALALLGQSHRETLTNPSTLSAQ